MDKQRCTKHTHKTKNGVTRTPLKPGGELRCSGRVGSSCSTSGTRHVNLKPIFFLRFSNSNCQYHFILKKTLAATLVEVLLIKLKLCFFSNSSGIPNNEMATCHGCTQTISLHQKIDPFANCQILLGDFE